MRRPCGLATSLIDLVLLGRPDQLPTNDQALRVTNGATAILPPLHAVGVLPFLPGAESSFLADSIPNSWSKDEFSRRIIRQLSAGTAAAVALPGFAACGLALLPTGSMNASEQEQRQVVSQLAGSSKKDV
jgi:hypothetical protein